MYVIGGNDKRGNVALQYFNSTVLHRRRKQASCDYSTAFPPKLPDGTPRVKEPSRRYSTPLSLLHAMERGPFFLRWIVSRSHALFKFGSNHSLVSPIRLFRTHATFTIRCLISRDKSSSRARYNYILVQLFLSTVYGTNTLHRTHKHTCL